MSCCDAFDGFSADGNASSISPCRLSRAGGRGFTLGGMRTAIRGAWRRAVGIVLVAASMAAVAGAAAPKADPAALDSAAFLLTEAITVSRDRGYHEMLRALRHLRDPGLSPLFEHIAASDRPVLQIHGILGLGEVASPRKVDLKRVAAMTDPLAQAELISAALDDNLLDTADCGQLVSSTGLDESVRLLVANELLRRGERVPDDLLSGALTSENVGRRALAGLMLLQLADPRGASALAEVDALEPGKRDGVRLMVLDTALKYEFDKVGPWALTVAKSEGLDARLSALALRAAMRYGGPAGEDVWLARYDATEDPAEQMRLALAALKLSMHIGPRPLAKLAGSDDPLLKQIGKAGQAVAAKKDIAPAMIGLVQMHNPVSNRLVMGYANEDASADDATLIFLSLILAYDGAPDAVKGTLLDDAIMSAQLLYEKSPESAAAMLGPIIGDPATDEKLVQAVLLGLVRTQEPGAERVIAGLPPMSNPHHAKIALLLRAKSAQALSAEELEQLSLLVRGGGRLQEPLRAQAAWAYVTRTGQVQAVLQRVLGGR